MLEMEGTVQEVLPNTQFRVRLTNGSDVLAYAGGKMRQRRIRIIAGDRVSLEDASRASGVGPFHLIRLFQRHFGLSPHAYLTQVRVAKSRRLLRLGHPVAQVALDVGFADQAHFTKRFKQLTGTTPAFYARSMQ